MKNNNFVFEIISCDGKKYTNEIVELNIKTSFDQKPLAITSSILYSVVIAFLVVLSSSNVVVSVEARISKVLGVTVASSVPTALYSFSVTTNFDSFNDLSSQVSFTL